MKKVLCFVCALVLVTSIAATAMAEPFTLRVQCVNTSTLTYSDSYGARIITNGILYVRHSVSGGSNSYTNLFHATKPTHWLLAQKWVTPNAKIPIQGNTIKEGLDCGIAARGNTKHYELDGVANVTLTGSYTAN